MDRTSFKLRMLSLKTYREQNPGKGYWEWKKAIQDYKGIDVDNDPTYDYYGFYNENRKTAQDILNDSKDAHFTDTYKTAVHPTFSNESKYSGYINKYNPKGIVGGYWGEDNSYNFSDSQIKNSWDIHNTLRYLENAENYGVTARYKGMYPKDTDGIIYGGVLPQVEVRAQAFENGGEKLPTIGKTTTDLYGNKTHYIATSIDDDGTVNLGLPDVVITPRNNLNLAGSVSKAMDNVARSGINAATYVTPLGDVEAVYDISKNINTGNYSRAALGAGLMLLPNFIEKPLKRITKLFKKSKVKKELEDAILLLDNIINKIEDNTPNISINKNNDDVINSTVNDIKIDANDLNNDIITENIPNTESVRQNDVIPDNNDLFADLDQDKTFDMFIRRNRERRAIDNGLFDQRFDDTVEELRSAILNDQELTHRYHDLLNSPDINLLEADDLYNRRINRTRPRVDFNLLENKYIHDLYDQYKQVRDQLPDVFVFNGIRSEARDRLALTQIRENIETATRFRDQIRSIPTEQWTLELYNRFSNETRDIRRYIPPFAFRRENRNINEELRDLFNNIVNDIESVGKEFRENERNLLFNLSNTAEQRLISEKQYDKYNLPEEFKTAKYVKGDVTTASYFGMSPRQAVEKGTRDFEKLKHGLAWNLTHNGAVSTDSYPLLLSLMLRHKDDGLIKVFRDQSGEIETMRLNTFGRVKGELALSRINKKLDLIALITGEKDLKAIYDDKDIIVPKISYRKYKDGGEVEPPYPQFINGQRVNRITGKPIATGQAKPLFDLEDFFNFTPVGDAITVKDTYDAAKQNDWSTAALSALTLIPFVPTTVKLFNRKYKGVTPKVKREIPTVNKNLVQEQINDIEKERLRRSRLINEADNQGYKIAERLMEDPAYIKRAAKVLKEYGDDYLTIYADILLAYNENPDLLMKSSLGSLQNGARARMEATSDAVRRHMNGGLFPGMGEYNYRIDPTNMRDLTGNVTDHEWNHYVDYLKNKQPDGLGSSNLFKRMSEDIEYSDNPLDIYYGKPTEQKAYMNQLREYMFLNGIISSRDEEVSKELLLDVLNNLTNRNMDSIVRASRRMNNMDNYTKWFNSIPLLGLGAMGINKYYNQQKEK